jgi:hypothetical protein
MLDNLKRILTMLEKALDRLARRCYYNREQYPEIFFEIEECIDNIRTWIQHNEIFSCLETFYISLCLFIDQLAMLISQLWEICKPKSGKKAINKTRRYQEKNKILKSINSMIEHIAQYIDVLKNDTVIAIELEKGVQRSFDKNIVQGLKNKIKDLISRRGEKTYIFAWKDTENYHSLIKDKKKFRAEVIDKLGEYSHATGHKNTCNGPKEYSLCGYRKNPRKTIMNGGKQEIFPIRMVQCKNCKQKFSLVPSFLPREKNFGIEIIGNVCRNMFLFYQSIQGSIENLKIIGKRSVKSKQTILNWTRWIGTLHPATILTRAGVKGTGYLQEDEGFEKEPNLKTYSVVMVDPENLLVWHADYVDHVDEETLSGSFEKFIQKISFRILGVTKDKWQASTNALKLVFHRIWIGYCHRHCLKKFRETLSKYQDETKCSQKDVATIYNNFRQLLKTSTSKANLEAKIKSLDDEAFSHPLLQERLAELKENAVHYTSHKNRKRITRTTSIVDNYLKTVKRKLRQIESFRDKEWAGLFFRAQANTRNFVPFLPGAKNAHQSPFMLAGGHTYDLPWMQVMNVHNAFLFVENAF